MSHFYLGITDRLTGVYNRKAIIWESDELLGSGADVACLMIDIDNFKEVVDYFGFTFSDDLLKQLADILTARFDGELVGRVGGDDFVVMLKNPPPENELKDMLVKVQSEISKSLSEIVKSAALPHYPDAVSVSIGAALSPRDGTASRTLIDNAESACLIAKNNGKNGVRICSEPCITDVKFVRRDVTERLYEYPTSEMDYGSFVSICRVMIRQLARKDGKPRFFSHRGRVIALLMLTICAADEQEADPIKPNQATVELSVTLSDLLYDKGIFAEYGNCQYTVLLTNPETSISVVEDIVAKFNRSHAGKLLLKCDVEYISADDYTPERQSDK